MNRREPRLQPSGLPRKVTQIWQPKPDRHRSGGGLDLQRQNPSGFSPKDPYRCACPICGSAETLVGEWRDDPGQSEPFFRRTAGVPAQRSVRWGPSSQGSPPFRVGAHTWRPLVEARALAVRCSCLQPAVAAPGLRGLAS
jgi:hypothetical protein